jgi:hypothetical protein
VSTEQWSDERVAGQFRHEVHERFVHENEEWLVEERAGIAKVKAEYDAKGEPYPDWIAERNSFYWQIYESCAFAFHLNTVDVLLPKGFAVYADFVAMFDGTSVAWSIPAIEAKIVDGEARLSIHITFIDYWDDERHAKWLAEKS